MGKLTSEQKQAIRAEVYRRQNGLCLDCGKGLTLEQMHCHEKVWRSKGGEMSLENSIGLCFACHIIWRHKRVPQFGKKKLDKEEKKC